MNIWTSYSSAPPVSAGEIQEWEQQNGVRMPAVLREALMIHNGGTIVDSVDPSIEVIPLKEWGLLDPELLELFHYEGDPRRLMAFANSDDGDCYYLNYARCNAAGEPVVGSMNHEEAWTWRKAVMMWRPTLPGWRTT